MCQPGKNPERLKHFLRTLPTERYYPFEFRNETWNVEPVYELRRRFDAAYCMFH